MSKVRFIRQFYKLFIALIMKRVIITFRYYDMSRLCLNNSYHITMNIAQ